MTSSKLTAKRLILDVSVDDAQAMKVSDAQHGLCEPLHHLLLAMSSF